MATEFYLGFFDRRPEENESTLVLARLLDRNTQHERWEIERTIPVQGGWPRGMTCLTDGTAIFDLVWMHNGLWRLDLGSPTSTPTRLAEVGQVHSVAAIQDAALVYTSNVKGINHVTTAGDISQLVATEGIPIGVAYDDVEGHVYWVEQSPTGFFLWRSDLDGCKQELAELPVDAWGLALINRSDLGYERVYYSNRDAKHGGIYLTDLVGKNRRLLDSTVPVVTSATENLSLTDRLYGHLVWSSGPRIYTMRLKSEVIREPWIVHPGGQRFAGTTVSCPVILGVGPP